MGSITLVLGVALIIFNIFVLLVINSFVDLPTIGVFRVVKSPCVSFCPILMLPFPTTRAVLGSEKFTLDATPWVRCCCGG